MADARTADFDEFYRGTATRVVHLVYASTGDLTLAQDCTQEAYARAWADWDRVCRADEPLAWVRTVARRLAISEWRRSRARDRAYTRHGVGPTARPPDETHVAVTRALRELPEEMREAVVLHYIADLPVDQIAAETGTPPGTVKARLHRGRARLARLLAETDPAPGRATPPDTTTARASRPRRGEPT